MATLGVKSVMFGGEGEPLLHRDIGSLAIHAKEVGLDVALTSNGVLFDKNTAEQIVASAEWFKVSINAGSAETYAAIHNTRKRDFDKVFDNLAYAAEYRAKTGAVCVLGMQILLLPENQQEVVALAQRAKGIGMDYLVVKPYSHNPASQTTQYKNLRYEEMDGLKETCAELNDNKFKVVLRLNTMRKWNEQVRGYDCCQALSFWSFIDSAGNVWGCSIYLGDDRFLYGNIYEESFRKIWEGEKRKRSMQLLEDELDPSSCRVNCRMDEVNRYLWSLRNPPPHVNFI